MDALLFILVASLLAWAAVRWPPAALVAVPVAALGGTAIPVAAVSTGFPAGLSPLHLRIEEIRESVAAGARETALGVLRGAPVEVDVVVIDRGGTIVGRAG